MGKHCTNVGEPTAAREYDDPDKLDILGQYYVAFGRGAESLRVSRAAIRELRERYWSSISRAEWEADAAYVLDLFRAIGRLAALFATQEGRITITADDVRHAAEMVQDQRRRHERETQLNEDVEQLAV